MRDIKFRAWNSDNKLVPQEGLQWNGVNFISGIWNHEETVIASEECVPLIEQFTGLTDKNGKDIYEGDQVKGQWVLMDDERELIAEVKINGALIHPFTEFVGNSSGMLYSTNINPSDFEVIGNIHQNPELLTCHR